MKKKDYAGKKVLITGASGFLGSHLCNALIEKGARITGLDFSKNKKNRIIKDYKKIKWIYGDVTNEQTLKKSMKNVELVFHLAALASVWKSEKDPFLAFDIHSKATINLLKIANKSKIRVIVASTTQVYDGHKKKGSYIEEEAKPDTFYGLSKLIAEEYGKEISKKQGLSVLFLRPSYIYGEGVYKRVLFDIITGLLDNNEIKLFMPQKNIIDMIHVDDVVCAFLAAGLSECSGESINIGTNKPIQIKKLIKEVSKILNKKRIKIILHEDAKQKTKRIVLNNAKAIKILRWKPKHSIQNDLACMIDIIKKAKKKE